MSSFKVTIEEHQLIESAAKAQEKAVSEWARDILLREAGRGVPERAIFTEIVALRQQLASFIGTLAMGKPISREAFDRLNAELRRNKHRTAREVLDQYTITEEE